ncbi:MAG: hypothetical protein FJY97_16390 [candidate division Zixibacteria bacterium]|nr:hypothetical protein [candidate division Zixibacteria bacterium]
MPFQHPPASILVLAERSDQWFASPEAYAELLRLEGINDVDTAYVEDLTPTLLEGRSVVWLGPSDPSPDAVKALIDHVYSGGGLICCMPGEAMAKALGLEPQLKGQMDGRLPVALDGFPDTGLPIKGWSAFYRVGRDAGCTDVMSLQDRRGDATGFPAVVELSEGDGAIAVLAYDPVSVVYLLRQGNPLLAGCRSSGFARMRPSDLFDGWQDERDFSWPVADLHGHFARELIHRVWPAGSTLPWLWYFPDGADSLLVFTSDDDWSTRPQFERLIDACETFDARLTFYLVQEKSVMDRMWMEELAGRGFDFSIHPDLPPPTLSLWDGRLGAHVRQFCDTYGRPPGSSVRNHCITWAGYLEGARIEARHGFTFDTNCFSLLPQGKYYLNGAGLPMRFVDTSGTVLPVFQLPTQFSDETTLGGQGFPFSLNLTPEQGIDLITGLIGRNTGPVASMMCINAHPVSFATYSAPLWEPVLSFARDSGVPVWDVGRFARFWEARRLVRLRPVKEGEMPEVDGAALAACGLSVMLPVSDSAAGGVIKQVGGRAYRRLYCAK